MNEVNKTQNLKKQNFDIFKRKYKHPGDISIPQ